MSAGSDTLSDWEPSGRKLRLPRARRHGVGDAPTGETRRFGPVSGISSGCRWQSSPVGWPRRAQSTDVLRRYRTGAISPAVDIKGSTTPAPDIRLSRTRQLQAVAGCNIRAAPGGHRGPPQLRGPAPTPSTAPCRAQRSRGSAEPHAHRVHPGAARGFLPLQRPPGA